MTLRTTETLPRTEGLRRDEMKEPDEVSAMLRLKLLGWGARRIAAELGCSRTTARRRLKEGTWRRPSPAPEGAGWAGDLARRSVPPPCRQRRCGPPGARLRKGLVVSFRNVERAVAHLRQEIRAEARATVRFETRPGQQLQIDFGQRRLAIAGTPGLVSFFVAKLGYSRRTCSKLNRVPGTKAWLRPTSGHSRSQTQASRAKGKGASRHRKGSGPSRHRAEVRHPTSPLIS